jgi:hypothetical protein
VAGTLLWVTDCARVLVGCERKDAAREEETSSMRLEMDPVKSI